MDADERGLAGNAAMLNGYCFLAVAALDPEDFEASEGCG